MIGDDSGLLVPPGDVPALAGAMLQLTRDPLLRRSMGQAALERYRKLFSPTAVVPLMMETYRRVIKNGNHPEQGNNGHLHPWAGISR